MLQRLAGVREQQEDWELAYQIYKQLGDQAALADIIERAGTTMLLRAVPTLETWLNNLAPSVVKQRPRLLSLRGAVEQIRGHADEAISLLDSAIAKMLHQDDREALAVARTRRGHAYTLLGSYEQAIQDASAAMNLTEGIDDLQIPYAEALRLRGLSRYYQGRSLEAADDLEAALNVCVRLGDSFRIPRLLMETGMVRAALGEYRRAEASYEKALAVWRESGNLFYQASLLNNYGFLKYQLGEYEGAAQALEEGLLCARRSGYRSMEALISVSMGDLYSEIEDFEIAAQNYRSADFLAQQLGDGFLINYLQIAEANLALLKREPMRARAILENASGSINEKNSKYEYGHLELARGRLALQEDLAGEAVQQLTEAKRCFAEDGREMECLWGSIWLASALSQTGEVASALEEIKTAVPNPNRISHSAVVSTRQAMDWLEPLRRDRAARALMRGLLDGADRLDDQLPATRRQLRRMARTIEVPAPDVDNPCLRPRPGMGQRKAGGRQRLANAGRTRAVLLFSGDEQAGFQGASGERAVAGHRRPGAAAVTVQERDVPPAAGGGAGNHSLRGRVLPPESGGRPRVRRGGI